MRILQICNKVPYPPDDGSSIAIYNISKGFIENDVALTLLSLNTRKHYKDPQLLKEAFEDSLDFRSVEVDTDIKLIPAFLNLFSKESYHVSRFIQRDFEELLITVLKEKSFDIVHIEGLFMAPYLPLIRKHSEAKVTLRAHNVEHQIWERMCQTEKNPLKRAYLKLLTRRLKNYELEVLNAFDAVIPITPVDEKKLQDLGVKTSYKVCPAALDKDEYPVRKEAEEAGTIFHIGALDWLPNTQAIRWFLDAIWPLVLQEKPEARFYIAARHIPEWLHKYKEQGVIVSDQVGKAQDFINSKSIMAVPLRSGSGMRIKILEGIALGKAIVTTSIGAEGINYTDGKDMIIADTEVTFARAIIACLEQPEKVTAIGREARKLMETHYSNKVVVKELLNFYTGLLK